MLRLRCVGSCLRRLFHGGTASRDQVLERLSVCSAEDQVFDIVDKHKATLAVNQVVCAVEMLWQFQKERPQLLRTMHFVNNHPQFFTLKVLAKYNIALMEDYMLLDTLYNFLRLQVDPRDHLVQQLVSEAWLRIDRLPMASLSKFAICLSHQRLQRSPLMGHITNIVDQRLSSIDDARILTTLTRSISFLVSTRLRDALISKADHLLDTMDPSHYNNPRRLIQFLHNINYNYRPLLEKCNQILLHNVPRMDVGHISMIMGLYLSLQFHNCDFRLAVKQRLIKLIDSSTDPYSFTKQFVWLASMASPDIRERLENTALLLADELSAQQALAILETLVESQSRNPSLLNKIASVIQQNLYVYDSEEVGRITQALYLLHYENPKLFIKLKNILVWYLQRSVFPHEVTMLTRVLSMLPCPQLSKTVISRVKAVATQCNLTDLNTISLATDKLIWNDLTFCKNATSRYIHLLQTLNHCGRQRLQTAERLDLVLEELKYVSGEWFEAMLLEETVAMLQRMMDQVNWSNVPELSLFLTRMNYLCPPLMDRIANVAIKDIDKIHPSAIYAILLPFSLLNYSPPQAEELYDACIQHVIPRICSIEPYLLVFIAYTMAVANCFPEELVREILSTNFLGKLNSQLEALPDVLNMQSRLLLMKLNRTVCLECPEFQAPWFQEYYCQRLQKEGSGIVSPMQKKFHKMLGEVLGGINRVRVSVATSYFYTVEFECILDSNLKPLPYSSLGTLQISEGAEFQSALNSLESVKDMLPPGAQRVAVEILDSNFFCKNSDHMKSEALIRKRHLEILGYNVVQIPHFEWNSMELSTQDAWKKYLKKKIFRELSS